MSIFTKNQQKPNQKMLQIKIKLKRKSVLMFFIKKKSRIFIFLSHLCDFKNHISRSLKFKIRKMSV